MRLYKQEALDYHSQGQPGKIEVVPTKMLSTQHDLALAYSPGVAEPCKEIAERKEDVYLYTAKGNLVAVISNGTAVLGLGDIGPEASKPVMEGKGVLFKKFAGIDVFDIEVDEKNPEEFIKIVKALEPTFGGVNLEDIKAPECFKIEAALREKMRIPVMHDDQHGTAIISAAALLNALEQVGKKIEDIKIVVNGAGAAAVSCTKLYLSLGARMENIVMCDSKGVIHEDRKGLDEMKKQFATKRKVNTLQEAVKGADFFLGLSVADVLAAEDVQAMADNPIVFALANPDPEIAYGAAIKSRPDIIMATGRSDHPNQVNNVLGFPYIFRGALDVRASEINEAMKLGAVHALADLAKEPVPEAVIKAYGLEKLSFGRDYLIPKPLDPRLLTMVASAVAKAAMDSGVAASPIADWALYKQQLLRRIGIDPAFVSKIMERASVNPKRVVFAEADQFKILMAAQTCVSEGIAHPVLLGKRAQILALIEKHQLDLNCPIIDPFEEKEKLKLYGDILYQKMQRKGLTRYQAEKQVLDRNTFGACMVELGEADALISGLTHDFTTVITPATQIIGMQNGIKNMAGMNILITKQGTFFFCDTLINSNPNEEELAEIISLSARAVRFFGMEPRIAVLSYSNFGSREGEVPAKVRRAVEWAKAKNPRTIIEGDIQANVALNLELQRERYPFSALAKEGANTLVFPNLESGNIAYKLVMQLGGAESIGPLTIGLKKPVHFLQFGCSVRDIINVTAISVIDAQMNEQDDLSSDMAVL